MKSLSAKTNLRYKAQLLARGLANVTFDMDLGEHDLIFMVDSEVTSGATLSAAETSAHLEFGIPFHNFVGRFALTYGATMALSAEKCDTWTVPLLAFPSVSELLKRSTFGARGETWVERRGRAWALCPGHFFVRRRGEYALAGEGPRDARAGNGAQDGGDGED